MQPNALPVRRVAKDTGSGPCFLSRPFGLPDPHQRRHAMDPAKDPSTLLCERCGYIIQGLAPPIACSECGLPIADSLPSARTGTPWQNCPGLIAWLRTNIALLRRTVAMFRIVRIEAGSGATLLAANLLIASVIVIAPWSGILLDNPFRNLAWGRSGTFAVEVLMT